MVISKKRFGRITPIQNSIYFVTTTAVNTTVQATEMSYQQQQGNYQSINGGENGKRNGVTDAAVMELLEVRTTSSRKSPRPKRRTSIISEPKEPPISEQ